METEVLENDDRSDYCKLEKENNTLSKLLKEKDDQLKVILYAMNLLSKIMCCRETDDKKSYKNTVIRELNELKSNWNLDETALPMILSEANKLESSLNVICSEADISESENKCLREKIKKSEEWNINLLKSLEKVYNQNVRLTNSLKKSRSKNKKLVSFLKLYSDKTQLELEENKNKKLELQTALHEMSLKDDDEISFASSSMSANIFERITPTVKLTKSREMQINIPAISEKLGLQFLLLPNKTNSTKGLFVVCGLHGFDATVNTCPELGSKLISIGSESLEEECNNYNSMSELHEKITNKIGATEDFILRFRKDELTKGQSEALNKAIIATNDSYSSSNKNTTIKVPYDSHHVISDSEERDGFSTNDTVSFLEEKKKALILREWKNDQKSIEKRNTNRTKTNVGNINDLVLRGWSTIDRSPQVNKDKKETKVVVPAKTTKSKENLQMCK